MTASSDSTLKLWDFEKGTAVATFTGEAAFRCCAAGRDGRIIAGDEIGRLHVLEISSGAL
jgi:WD40 repeat protein